MKRRIEEVKIMTMKQIFNTAAYTITICEENYEYMENDLRTRYEDAENCYSRYSNDWYYHDR